MKIKRSAGCQRVREPCSAQSAASVISPPHRYLIFLEVISWETLLGRWEGKEAKRELNNASRLRTQHISRCQANRMCRIVVIYSLVIHSPLSPHDRLLKTPFAPTSWSCKKIVEYPPSKSEKYQYIELNPINKCQPFAFSVKNYDSPRQDSPDMKLCPLQSSKPSISLHLVPFVENLPISNH